MNFPHKEQNGILRHLYRKNNAYYNDTRIFSYDSSGFVKEYLHYPHYIFDFGSNDHWFDSANEVFVSFCFEKGFASIKGYEIKGSSGTHQVKKWAFSGSIDNKNWLYNTTIEHAMIADEVFYVDWHHGPFKCFRIDIIQNVVNNYRMGDVKQVELFGIFYPDNNFFCKTMKHRFTLNTRMIHITLILSNC